MLSLECAEGENYKKGELWENVASTALKNCGKPTKIYPKTLVSMALKITVNF
jgi:hypothetical protein